jgi:trimeric autotransporter adhesin
MFPILLRQYFEPVFTLGFEVQAYNLKILSRWGELLFESNDVKVGWDGTYNGSIAPDTIYNWVIEFKDLNSDERKVINGHVSLLH